MGGGGDAARLFLLFSFPCSADHERDWTSCKVVFFGLATNTLNVRNNKQQTTTCIHTYIQHTYIHSPLSRLIRGFRNK